MENHGGNHGEHHGDDMEKYPTFPIFFWSLSIFSATARQQLAKWHAAKAAEKARNVGPGGEASQFWRELLGGTLW